MYIQIIWKNNISSSISKYLFFKWRSLRNNFKLFFLYKIPRETEINPKSMQNEEYMYLLIYPIYMYRLKEKVVKFFFIAENLINEKKKKSNFRLDS